MNVSHGQGNSGFVQYHFRDAIGGFFEFPTENARALLPSELQPIEPHHGSSVLSVMAFDFHDSPVGEYGELILSIFVSPLVQPGQPMPRAAFYPFKLGTTTRESLSRTSATCVASSLAMATFRGCVQVRPRDW